MCDKAVNRYFFVFHSIPDQFKTQEICETVASEDPSLILYCSDKYKTQTTCDKTVDDCLAALFLIGLLQVKWLNNFLLLCMQIKYTLL